jgi:hypothetical protein
MYIHASRVHPSGTLPLGRYAPVVVNSGLRPETRKSTREVQRLLPMILYLKQKSSCLRYRRMSLLVAFSCELKAAVVLGGFFTSLSRAVWSARKTVWLDA